MAYFMTRHLLLTRPDHDYATRYLSIWAEKFFNLAKDKGYSIIDLFRERANHKEIESVFHKRNPCFVIINGHGDDKFVAGYENEPLLIAKINSFLLQGKIIYAISCRSARILGEEVGQYENTAYIGYKDDFILLYLERYRTRPTEDKLAGFFLEPSNLVVTTLLKGHTAGKAVMKARREFFRNIQQLLTSKTKAEDSSAVRYLLWNMNNLVVCGDKDKKLS